MQLFRSPCFGLDADSIKIIPALKKELVRQQEKLLHQLRTIWHQTIIFTIDDSDKGARKTRINSLTIRVTSDNKERPKESITELVQALANCQLLDDLLGPFVSHLKSHFITVLVNHSCSVDATPETLTVTYNSQPAGPSSNARLQPGEVFTRLRHLVLFLEERLDVPLSNTVQEQEEPERLLQRLGASLSGWLCDTLIRYRYRYWYHLRTSASYLWPARYGII